MRWLKISVLIFLLVQIAPAQYYGAIQSDRPGYGLSVHLLKRGRFQVETGSFYTRDQERGIDTEQLQLGKTLFRLGVNEYFELRAGSQVTYRDSNRDHDGDEFWTVQGAFVGTKIGIHQSESGPVPSLALVVRTDLPVGSKKLVNDAIEPQAVLAASNRLSEAASFDYNLGLANRNKENLEFLTTMALKVQFSPQTTAFVEYVYQKQETQDARIYFDGGLSFLLERNLLLDIFGGRGMNTISEDWFFSAGLSWRLPR